MMTRRFFLAAPAIAAAASLMPVRPFVWHGTDVWSTEAVGGMFWTWRRIGLSGRLFAVYADAMRTQRLAEPPHHLSRVARRHHPLAPAIP